jgi:hypothetical protein
MGDSGDSCLDYLWRGSAITGDGGSTDVSQTLGLSEAPNMMHGLSIVPHHGVMRLPVIYTGKSRLCRMFDQVAQIDTRFGHRSSHNRTGM